MTSPARNSDGDLDDPGRDPVGLEEPRNPIGGADQDTGRGKPKGSPGVEGESMMPEAPEEHDEHA